MLEPRNVVAHSLGSHIAENLVEKNEDIIQSVRAYGSPTMSQHPKVQHFRHRNDPISAPAAFINYIQNNPKSSGTSGFKLNPLEAHGYRGY